MLRRSPRSFGWLLAVMAALLLAPVATSLAQEATPAASPVADLGEAAASQTRDEFTAELEAEMGYSAPEQEGGTFLTTSSTLADIQGLNPLLAEEVTTIVNLGYIYDQLVGSDPRTGVPAPTGLADSWEVADDGVTYTFYLNQDAVWHDGTPLTSADVVFSMDALASPDTGSVYNGNFTSAVASYRAIDDYTVEIVAKEPIFSFLYEITLWIVPQHIWGEIPFTEWRTHPISTGQDQAQVIGSGAFMLESWTPGDRLTLVRNESYYGKVPYIDTLVMQVLPDQTSVVNAFLNGELDVAGLEPPDVAAIEGTEGIEIAIFDTQDFSYVEFNLDAEVTTLFQDEPLRQAFFYAIDRQSIADNILLGYAEVAQGTQPVISYAYAPEEATITYDYNPDRARELLAEAGWEDTNGDGTVDKDGRELAFEYLYPAGSAVTDQIAAYLQDAWSEVGISATPRSLEFPALIEATTTNPTYALAAYGFAWDASFLQDAMFGCDQYQVGFNDMRYCNPELDVINDEAKRTFDEAARRDLLIQASNIVNEEVPIMVLHFSEAIVAYSSRVHNYIPGAWGTPIGYIWLSQ